MTLYRAKTVSLSDSGWDWYPLKGLSLAFIKTFIIAIQFVYDNMGGTEAGTGSLAG